MASILIHPTLAASPSHAAAFEHRHGMALVIDGRLVKAIPAIHHRRAAMANRKPMGGSWTGGDAA